MLLPASGKGGTSPAPYAPSQPDWLFSPRFQ